MQKYMMKYFFGAILLAVFVATLASSKMKPTKLSNIDEKKAHCNVINYFYAGPNTKKIEQQLAEIREEIRALKGNKTGGPNGKGSFQYFL